ncbi:MAG: transposase [Planctomycetota bacterium]|jgi:hypothetical protein
MRRLRLVQQGGELKILHVRTARDCPFLRPDPRGQVNALVCGVLGKAQQRTGIDVIAVTVLPHEIRIYVWAHDAQELRDFTQFFDGNISKVIGELPDVRQRGGSFWRDRYRDIRVSDATADQVAAFREILAAPCTEGYVDHPAEWPGVHCVDALTQGKAQLRGVWYGKGGQREDVTVRLSPLPCWASLSVAQRRGMTRRIVGEIHKSTLQRRKKTGRASCGAAAVMALVPQEGPADVPTWETPAFFSLDKGTLDSMRNAYLTVVEGFRRAADALPLVDLVIPFPAGTFPPPVPIAGPPPDG